MGGKDREKTSTLDEMINQKETDLIRLRKLRIKRMEIQFFKGVADVASGVAAKMESGDNLTLNEKEFRRRLYEGLSLFELLSLFFDKAFRRRKAVIFSPKA
jgi:hypothetical protein